MTANVVLVYGILVAAGGIMGFIKSQSKPSLISGLIFGILLVGCSVLMRDGNEFATYSALGLSVALLAIFVMRFRISKKFMPAGLMIIMSLAAAVVLLLEVF